jgi:hypothetical protein
MLPSFRSLPKSSYPPACLGAWAGPCCSVPQAAARPGGKTDSRRHTVGSNSAHTAAAAREGGWFVSTINSPMQHRSAEACSSCRWQGGVPRPARSATADGRRMWGMRGASASCARHPLAPSLQSQLVTHRTGARSEVKAARLALLIVEVEGLILQCSSVSFSRLCPMAWDAGLPRARGGTIRHRFVVDHAPMPQRQGV